MPIVQGPISIVWNSLGKVTSTATITYSICNQNIHLARYINDLYGSIDKMRSSNLYNIYYRMIGKEMCKVNQEQMSSLFNLFLLSADFSSLKSKWASSIGFDFRSSFSESQYRNLLYAFRDAFFRDSTPKSIKLALQHALQIDGNKVQVLEFFKDSALMGFFSFDWAVRDAATLIYTGTTDGSAGENTPNFLKDSVFLASAITDQYVGHKIVITSGVGLAQVRTVIANDQIFFTLDSDWDTPPQPGDGYVLSIFFSERDNIQSLRPNDEFYAPFGLSNYGFQIWATIDDYLNVAGFINDYVKAVKLAYTRYAIAYILHRNFAGSLTAALLNQSTNPSFIAIGTGDPSWDPYNPTPSGGEFQLYNETARVIALANFMDENEQPTITPTRFLELSGFFVPGVGTSERVMEVGLYAEDGVTLLAYQAFSAVKKKVDEAFIWKWRSTYDSL